MQIQKDDPRLSAALLSRDEFVGQVESNGDIGSSFHLVELHQPREFWGHLPELKLLMPIADYSLRCQIPATSHSVFLMYKGMVVGCFVETDSLAILDTHQGKNLSRELILAAFAQKQWCSPTRKVSKAGEKALVNAYEFICDVQKKLL